MDTSSTDQDNKDQKYNLSVDVLRNDVKEAIEHAKLSRSFKIHFVLAVGVTAACFASKFPACI